jgi:hypothetical protein
MPLLDLQAPPEKQPLILPHLADGGGYRTEFWLMNPTAEEISGSAAFFDSRGAPLVLTLNGTAQSALEYRLAGYGLQRMVSAGEAAAVRSGYALLTPGSRSTAVAGSGVFSFLQAGGSRSEAGVPFTSARQGAQLFVRQAEQNGQRQIPGLAIANAGATAATLRLTLYDVTGLTVLGPSSVTLAPGEQRARFLDEWLTALPARYEGMLQIASDVPVAALGLIGYLNLSGDFIMSTLAADMPAAWNRRLLPHLATGGDYRSEIMLLPPAVSISAGALRFLTNLGRPWFVALP